jgi:hypothetical protein
MDMMPRGLGEGIHSRPVVEGMHLTWKVETTDADPNVQRLTLMKLDGLIRVTRLGAVPVDHRRRQQQTVTGMASFTRMAQASSGLGRRVSMRVSTGR